MLLNIFQQLADNENKSEHSKNDTQAKMITNQSSEKADRSGHKKKNIQAAGDRQPMSDRDGKPTSAVRQKRLSETIRPDTAQEKEKRSFLSIYVWITGFIVFMVFAVFACKLYRKKR